MTQAQQPNLNFERIAGKLQQRLAEQAARYEGDLAIQADQYETQIEELQALLAEKTSAVESLKAGKKEEVK